jgi:hypothetical protein
LAVDELAAQAGVDHPLSHRFEGNGSELGGRGQAVQFADQGDGQLLSRTSFV